MWIILIGYKCDVCRLTCVHPETSGRKLTIVVASYGWVARIFGQSISWVHLKRASLCFVASLRTSASHSCRVPPKCSNRASQAIAPSRTELRKFVLISIVVKDSDPCGRWRKAPEPQVVSARPITIAACRKPLGAMKSGRTVKRLETLPGDIHTNSTPIRPGRHPLKRFCIKLRVNSLRKGGTFNG